MEKASGSTYVVQGEGKNGKLYCILCAVWLSSKGAILKDHVLGKNKKQPDGFYARQPGTLAQKAALQPVPPPEQVQQPQAFSLLGHILTVPTEFSHVDRQ